MGEREKRRALNVLSSINKEAGMAMGLGAEAQANAIQAIYNRAALVVSPQPDDEILRLWDEGEYSEGWATLALGVKNRLEARKMLNEYRARQKGSLTEAFEELAEALGSYYEGIDDVDGYVAKLRRGEEMDDGNKQ